MAVVISLKSEQVFVSVTASMNSPVCKESTVHYVLDITRIIKNDSVYNRGLQNLLQCTGHHTIKKRPFLKSALALLSHIHFSFGVLCRSGFTWCVSYVVCST